ncbi:MAG: glycosyltransferase family 1 protein [Deltaproteobacteria bacterium]|nr:MAG: glycosyltransferase family 1 protein [Deltaproteobacteria bacterium]
MRRGRVLLLTALPPPAGGVATWASDLLSWGGFSGVELRAIRRTAGKLDGSRWQNRWHRLRIASSSTLEALGALQRGEADVLHLCQTGRPQGVVRDLPLLIAAHRAGVPVVVHIHGSATRLAPWVLRSPVRRLLRAVRAWIVLDQSSQEHLERLGLGPVVRIPNAVPAVGLPRALPTEGKRLRVVYVGWMKPAKGVLDLLCACRDLPEVELTMMGRYVSEEGVVCEPQVTALAASAELRGRVHLRGEVSREQVHQELARAQVFALPSYSEGLPMALLEAMMAGLPAIVTRVGGMPEAVIEGRTGRVIDPGDVAALREALASYAREPDLAAAHGRAARELAVARYGQQAIYARLEALWSELIEAAP